MHTSVGKSKNSPSQFGEMLCIMCTMHYSKKIFQGSYGRMERMEKGTISLSLLQLIMLEDGAEGAL